ncbi:MAG TPA: XdhC family protein [Acidimicrobiales bacterium]|nr:XdhC family protein [Acidimicrobiales bacterium]
MANAEVLARSAELRAARVPFVRALVVLAERPTSAKPGDEALVLPDGSMEGFVGGTCAESTVRDQSLALLQSGDTLVLRITPVPEDDQPGKRVVHNPCLSGGTLELFLEPSFPRPLVLVVGRAPIADALRSLGGWLGCDLRSWEGEVAADTAALVVASHGRAEEDALTAALQAGVPYVGLVASPTRGRAVVASLEVDDEMKARVHTPAGFDIGARTPHEVALSILAEIVALRPRAGTGADGASGAPVVGVGAAGAPGGRATTVIAGIDPVCGMSVAAGDDALHLEHEGSVVWFCGRGCRQAFAADPAAYAR